jgi:hypothetical protein
VIVHPPNDFIGRGCFIHAHGIARHDGIYPAEQITPSSRRWRKSPSEMTPANDPLSSIMGYPRWLVSSKRRMASSSGAFGLTVANHAGNGCHANLMCVAPIQCAVANNF